MRVVVLGSGTSTGVPMIGCKCKVCRSNDLKDKRLRTSIIIEEKGKNFLVDTTPDFRAQALNNNITKIDAVLYTHDHADHINGIDDLRMFNFIQKTKIPCFASKQFIENIKNRFNYIFSDYCKGGGKPELQFNELKEKNNIYGVEVFAFPVIHWQTDVMGFRINNFAYVTDVKSIPPDSMKHLEGLDVLILGVLRQKEHSTHLCISEALKLLEILKPKKAYFIHMSHHIDYKREQKHLPENVEFCFDGMTISL